MQNQEFKIQIPITRAYYDENGQMMFEGTASSTAVDSHETIFNASAQEGMSEDINDGIARGEPVELESEHNGDEEPMNVLGPVISAEVVDNGDKKELKIVARLDPDNPKAIYYFNKMTRKDAITGKVKQFGLSINGYVVEAHYEYNKELEKTIRVFDRLKLRRIGIVRKPSNPDSWVEKIIRSVEWEKVETLKNDSNIIEENNVSNITNEIKERSDIEMSDKNTDNKETVVPTEGETVRTEAGDNGVTPDATAPETVSEAQDQNQDNVERVNGDENANVENAKTEVDAEVENRAEEVVDENKEQISRANYWTGGSLIGALGCVLDAICVLEDISRYDSEQVDSGMTDEAMKAAKECFGKLQTLLGDHVAETRTEEVETAEEVANRSNETKLEAAAETAVADAVVGPNLDEVIRGVSEFLNTDFTDSLTRKFEEMLEKSVTEKLAEVTEQNNKAVTELRNEISTLSKDKAELVERLVKVEAEPASRPGAQLLEQVNRNKEVSDKREANIKRAQEEGNTSELIAHRVYGKAYIGYGEYAKLD